MLEALIEANICNRVLVTVNKLCATDSNISSDEEK